jgi:hypothetical protein
MVVDVDVDMDIGMSVDMDIDVAANVDADVYRVRWHLHHNPFIYGPVSKVAYID